MVIYFLNVFVFLFGKLLNLPFLKIVQILIGIFQNYPSSGNKESQFPGSITICNVILNI